MLEKHLRKFPIHDEEALKDYLKLVSIVHGDDEAGYFEKHHICPKSMFPEFRLSKWNLVKLTYDEHIEAHRLLCLMYKTGNMKRAYSFIARNELDDKISAMTAGAFTGGANPSKRPEVRRKISEAKTGVPRNDIKGKKYFGADEARVKAGLDKMRKKLSRTVVVKDKDGKRFRVSVEDPRYLSGELVSFNMGETRENSASKRPEVMKQIMSTRNKTYEKFARFTFDEMVDFLVSEHDSGKRIFAKKKPFASNYSSYVKRSPHDPNELFKAVVQRLSKTRETGSE